MENEQIVKIGILSGPCKVVHVHILFTKLCAAGSVLDGVICVILGTFLVFWLDSYEPAKIGVAIWTGILGISNGAIGFKSASSPKNHRWNLSHLVLHSLTCVVVCICLVICVVSSIVLSGYSNDVLCHATVRERSHNGTVHAMNTSSTTQNSLVALPDCAGPPWGRRAGLALFVCLCLLMIFQLALSIAAIVLSCIGGGYCKCNLGGEVPYEEYVNGVGPDVEQGKQSLRSQIIQKGEWTNPTLHVPGDSDNHETRPLGR